MFSHWTIALTIKNMDDSKTLGKGKKSLANRMVLEGIK
jgi:hypothetical protein